VKSNAGAAFADGEVAGMAMLSIMIVISVASFLIVAALGGRRKRGLYFLYAAAMLLVYFAVVKVEDGGGPVGIVKSFYEIYPLNQDGWMAVFVICAASSVILVAAQRIRAAILEKAN
jgi:hypothetical protein